MIRGSIMTKSNKSNSQVSEVNQAVIDKDSETKRLLEEKKLLESELETLRQIKVLNEQPQKKNTFWRSFFAGITAAIAIICLILFNISYWTQNTIINNDQFVSTMSPLIKDPDIQAALQTEITNQIFSRVNLEQELEKVLPNNLDFIAAPFADQVKSFATTEVGKILKSQQAADAWTKLLSATHSNIIAYLQNPNNDGTISVDSLYKIAADQLQGTSIGFLFKNQLPASVGNITITQIKGVPEAQKYIKLLQSTTRQLALVGLIALAIAIALSTKRRKIVITILVIGGIGLAITIGAIGIAQSQVGSQVASQYSAAASAVFRIISQPLISHTKGFEALILALLFITIISAPYNWLIWARGYVNKGFDGVIKRVISHNKGLPGWIFIVSEQRVKIGWVLIGLSFIIFAFRLPPTVDGAWGALISSAIVVFILEIFASLGRCRSISKSSKRK